MQREIIFLLVYVVQRLSAGSTQERLVCNHLTMMEFLHKNYMATVLGLQGTWVVVMTCSHQPCCYRARSGGGSREIITERIPPFCLWGFLPPRPPARFKMPAARGKTSLNARDW